MVVLEEGKMTGSRMRVYMRGSKISKERKRERERERRVSSRPKLGATGDEL